MGMNLSELWETVKDTGTWCAVVYGVAESDMTWWLNNKKWMNRSFDPYNPLSLIGGHYFRDKKNQLHSESSLLQVTQKGSKSVLQSISQL